MRYGVSFMLFFKFGVLKHAFFLKLLLLSFLFLGTWAMLQEHVGNQAQSLPKLEKEQGFFYITSNPSFSEIEFTTVMRARYMFFSQKMILEQYEYALNRHYQKSASNYMHHAKVEGPYKTHKEAEEARKELVDLMNSYSPFYSSSTMYFPQSEDELLRNLPQRPFVFSYLDDIVLVLWSENYLLQKSEAEQIALVEREVLYEGFDQVPVFLRHYNLPEPNKEHPRMPELSNVLLVVVVAPEIIYAGEVEVFAQKLNALLAPNSQTSQGNVLSESTKIAVISRDKGFTEAWNKLTATQSIIASKGLIDGVILVGGSDMSEEELQEKFKTVVKRHVQPWKPQVKINELLASNNSGQQDTAGEFDDWIEIYNQTDAPINLAGMFLSDENDLSNKWMVPDDNPDQTTIPPKGYLVIWCDDQPHQGPLHATFKLSKSGESLTLIDIDGKTVIDKVDFGSQVTDVTYGRRSDGDNAWGTMLSMTPGKPNIEE